jgi:hypothetical protein
MPGEMDPILNQELKSLECIPITEERAEGIHRDVSRTVSGATGSKYPWWAATLRMDCNIKLTEVVSDARCSPHTIDVVVHRASSFCEVDP